ncbi:alpha/beta hydrolase [Psychrobacter sp. FME5]|uniref:alpha/beta hydrolase n=1 Tax=Psychrobacter sp. FME5 TaxID=2487706 RepID=UPI001788338B|nr:alpha/beta hydrolase [Psychrobacter sp. FME5]MBE0445643.1 alpha/beta hydrolase [Psychrobacter sp. FME5]MDN5801532.1 lysophospholipase [Psychrobacter sp.]MDN5891722.1 lysophospholipase [Psychrobacter sp.]MDN5897728.1 lysophospholipase [Psychrobacter sp.]
MSTAEQTTSSDNTHYLHHTFFEPSDNETAITATLLIVHGMAEHSGRYADFAQFLADNGIAVATYDQLGHGKTIKSEDDFGFFGEEHPVQSLLKDVIVMADSLKERHPNVPHFVMGHSMGSFIVRNVLKHHARNFTGAILMGTADANPLTKVLLPVNKLLAKAAPKKPNALFANVMNKVLNSKLDNRISSSPFAWINENPAAIEAYEADPLTGFDFTNNGFMTLFTLMEAGLNKNWATTIAKDFPMLLLSGENDPIGDMGRGIRKIASRLDKQHFNQVSVQLYPHMRHEPLHEKNNKVVYQDILEWLDSNTSDH